MTALLLAAAARAPEIPVELFPFAEYWWFYLAFLALVGVLLALDLGVFHRHAHTVSIKEASLWSLVWVSLALAFNFGLYRYLLHKLPNDPRLAAIPGFDPAQTAWTVALQFLAGYIVEYSLSIDNIFVFVVVLNYFMIPSEYQHRVLFFGILGALVFRAIFITIGAALIQYNWVVILFGVFLIYTGIRMMLAKEEGVEPDENAAIRLFRKRMPVTNDLHGQKFFVNIDGRKHATPLFIAVLFLEMTDIVFAVDSVPAIFALTSEPLIVFTSNIFAILGLRNLYFMLRGAIDKFHLLKYGLGIVLIFVGCKMTFLGRFFEGGHVPIELSLGVILGVIFLSILASLIFRQGPHDKDVPPLPMPIGHQAMTHDVHRKTEAKEKKLSPDKERTSKEITPKGEDYSQWYLDVVLKTELADYGPVKGMMVIRPYGYAVWEAMQADMDRRIKETGHVNAYFPLLIPKSFLEKEKEHVEGFSPECAWVTIGGGAELEEPLAIRPTSEAMICSMYAKWVHSWRDLPVLINQWANVLRWEKVTRPFLRTTEFLWQEGHTLHATEAEAEEETLKMLNVYRSFSEEILAMPVIVGRKSESEKFAGALRTYAIEALMGDGKALQAGTSHNLGQHFATAYGIEFLDKNQERALPWSTSWGTSTRMIGGLIMTHGDDAGLILPPRVAPYQVVIVPIPPRKGDVNEAVLPRARELASRLRTAGVRVYVDDRDTHLPGFKYADWEMRGVPLRLELGPKDIEKDQCVLVRRDTREKAFVSQAGLEADVRARLEAIQRDLLERARKFVADHTTHAGSWDEFKLVMAEKRGFIVAGWCGNAACEARIKEETRATVRVIPIDGEPRPGVCVRCGEASPRDVYFAQAY